jgi:hypothetical protein
MQALTKVDVNELDEVVKHVKNTTAGDFRANITGTSIVNKIKSFVQTKKH